MFLKLFAESFLFALQALRVNKLRTFLSLLGTKETQQRIEHMLKTGKPLRN